MKLLLDMNLSPALCDAFAKRGVEAIHWSQVGPAEATDQQILQWADANGCVVFTHDLDFGAILAGSGEKRASVIQVRAPNLLDHELVSVVAGVVHDQEAVLQAGALVVIEPHRQRMRILPLDNPQSEQDSDPWPRSS